jgi:16S rRNA C967 or C1407 C5-methylase (RsmB/RsmF family)/NOL1/NOP2/fmu family ribosome biogenesis protein
MRQYIGEEWQDFAAAHAEKPATSIRLNPKKNKSHLLRDRIPWTSMGYYLDERPSFTLDPLFHAGKYYVQEASSMLLEQAFLQSVDLSRPINVLDLCAAPGGKSTHLVSLINDDSLLISNEVIRSRAKTLEENIIKWGNNNVVVTNNDPSDFQALQGFFDVIVIDAPCSGEGLFRKDPASMQEWSVENTALCSKRQRRIIMDVWPSLKQGGILIYSTCTFNADENERILDWLHEQDEMESIPLKLEENWGARPVNAQSTAGYGLYPHRVRGEGLFISVLRKTSATNEVRIKKNNSFSSPSKIILEKLTPWIRQSGDKAFILRQDKIQIFPHQKLNELSLLANHLYILIAGTPLAAVKHNKLIPDHAAALSTALSAEHFSSIAVDYNDALHFLRKEPMSVHSTKKGFALITHKDLPLGWVNGLGNRLNNLYPSDWRIRMSPANQK